MYGSTRWLFVTEDGRPVPDGYKEILFKKVPLARNSCEDVSIITIFDNPPRVSTKRPVRITYVPKFSPLIITMSGPIPYSSDKVVPWNYGAGVYYHGVKQDLLAIEDKVAEGTDPDVDNIVRTSKITRSGSVFSPEISPKTIATPVIILATDPVSIPIDTLVDSPTIIPATETRGKEVLFEHVETKAHPEVIPEAYRKEIEEILKISRKVTTTSWNSWGKPPRKYQCWPYSCVLRPMPRPW